MELRTIPEWPEQKLLSTNFAISFKFDKILVWSLILEFVFFFFEGEKKEFFIIIIILTL